MLWICLWPSCYFGVSCMFNFQRNQHTDFYYDVLPFISSSLPQPHLLRSELAIPLLFKVKPQQPASSHLSFCWAWAKVQGLRQTFRSHLPFAYGPAASNWVKIAVSLWTEPLCAAWPTKENIHMALLKVPAQVVGVQSHPSIKIQATATWFHQKSQYRSVNLVSKLLFVC